MRRSTQLIVDHSGGEVTLAAWASTIGPSGWYILEGYTRLEFETWTPGSPLPDLTDVFAGRLFGPDAELRWTCEGGAFDLWRIREGVPAGERAVNAVERYYWGWAYFEKGRLWDPRLHKTPQYPALPRKPRDHDRPRFTVVEYYDDMLDRNPTTREEAERLLNAPRFAGYRLRGFDFHSGEEE